MNKIGNKIGTYEINKISFSCFLDKVHMLNNVYISKYNPLADSSYIVLPKEVNHPKKILLIFKILMIINSLNDI